MTHEAYVQGFGCAPDPTPYAEAKTVLLPLPLEWGSGGGEMPGVALGPLAVLGASRFVETYDVELGFDPLDRGVATLEGVLFDYGTLEGPLLQVRERVDRVLADGKFPLCLGGERTIVWPAAEAARAALDEEEELGVVLVARGPGLLDRAAGRSLAPQTLGRRLAEAFPAAVVGARRWTAEEARFMESSEAPPVIGARQLEQLQTGGRALSLELPRKIHLSIDVGVLDPAFLPIPGNVEPGGLSWLSLTRLVDDLYEQHSVVSCDVSGFAPRLGDVAPSLAVAQLVLRCLGRALVDHGRK